MVRAKCPEQKELSKLFKEVHDDKVLRAAILILSYLRKNPHAKDTAEGIAQWWVHEDAKIVEKALELLTKEGVAEKKSNAYQLKQYQ